MTFVFYDTETTGLEAPYDQIVQFAAIRTDADFNELDRVNLRCRLRPHIVPSEEALAVTGLTLEDLQDPSLPSNYEMAVQLSELLGSWSPSVFIGHNTINFDEAFLRQLFYQNLLPIYLTNTRGNSRADTLVMARAFADARPGSFEVPSDHDGKSIFKLEHLALANGFGAFKAHDALADVEATVFLARLLRAADPDLFDHFIDMGSRQNAEALLRLDKPVFRHFSMNGDRELLPLGALPDLCPEHGRVATIDLTLPVDELLKIDLENYETLAGLRLGGRQIIRKIATNRSPAIVSAELSGFAGNGVFEHWKEKLAVLRQDEVFLRKIREFLVRVQPEYERSENVEEQILDGFPSRSDEVLLEQFHRISWVERWKLLRNFDAIRWKSLGQRLIAEHAPEVLPDEVVGKYHEWVRARIVERESAEPEH
jgi:exodeoxyribonuclease I